LLATIWTVFAKSLPSEHLSVVTVLIVVMSAFIIGYVIFSHRSEQQEIERAESLRQLEAAHVQALPVVEAPKHWKPTAATSSESSEIDIHIGEVSFEQTTFTINAAVPGTRFWNIDCEFCGERFVGRRTETAVASAGNEGNLPESQRLAHERAIAHVRKMLAKTLPVEPCPKCGRFQRKMLWQWRRNRIVFAAFMVVIIAVIVSIKLAVKGQMNGFAMRMMAGVGASLFALAVMVILCLSPVKKRLPTPPGT